MEVNDGLTLSVIGLGKLGSPMAAVFADAGFTVIGCDIQESAVSALAQGLAPVEETGLQELLDGASGLITATLDVKKAAIEGDIIFVIVPTPSGADKCFKNDYILDAIQSIGRGIKESSTSEKLVVITSTVMPGATGGVIANALEEASGKKLGADLGLCYNPEFIALGSVIADMHSPDFILIGESAPKWGEILEGIYKKSCKNKPVFRRMNFVNAEITKIAVNTYTTTKISYANMLSEICDKLDGADADVVSYAVGADSRVGIKYLKPGVGYGGPCFPRDNKAFIALAESVGANAAIASATDAINDHQLKRYGDAIRDNLPSGSTIGVLGLSYKNNTQVIEASQGWLLAESLPQMGYKTYVYDPNVEAVPKGCFRAPSTPALLSEVSAVVLMLPFGDFEADFRQAGLFNMTVIDPWRIARSLSGVKGVTYVPLGVSGV